MLSIFSKSSNSFRQQYPGENTVFVTRKHWIILIAPLLFLFFLLLLSLIIYTLLSSNIWFLAVSSLFNFLFSVWILLLWNIAFYNIMLYFLNTVIVTNQRVIQNKQTGFFQYANNELRLDKIQDISVNISGPLATFLQYGNLEIQSAGTQNKFYFDTLPNPETIKKIIMNQEIKEN